MLSGHRLRLRVRLQIHFILVEVNTSLTVVTNYNLSHLSRHLINFFYLELEVILLKVVAVGTSTLSKLFMIDVTSIKHHFDKAAFKFSNFLGVPI
jgi:hypothetical protein